MYVAMATEQIPSTPRQRREWIKYQLGLRGLTLGSLAREEKVARSTARKCLYEPYPKWEQKIAKRLGVKPQQLWPERYDSFGRPSRRMGRPRNNEGVHSSKANTARAAGNAQ